MQQLCPECGEAITMQVQMLGTTFTVARPCKCKRAQYTALREEEARRDTQTLQRERIRQCFGSANLSHCTFENDDTPTCAASIAARKYAANFKAMQQQNLGLLFYGGVGVGKSFYAAAIANALLQQGYSAIMTNFTEAVQLLQSSFDTQHETLARFARVSLLVLDDLGTERGSEYMQEQVYSIIDARYRARRPLIVTTNIPIEEIKFPRQLAYSRIYDRILQMCHPVKAEGESRRRTQLKQTYHERNKLLGLE